VIIKSQDGNQVIAALDDSTKVQAIKGKLGLRRSDLGFTALVPGLPVDVEAEGPPDKLVAKSIKFKAGDLKTANQIQAGLTPSGQELAATKETGPGQPAKDPGAAGAAPGPECANPGEPAKD